MFRIQRSYLKKFIRASVMSSIILMRIKLPDATCLRDSLIMDCLMLLIWKLNQALKRLEKDYIRNLTSFINMKEKKLKDMRRNIVKVSIGIKISITNSQSKRVKIRSTSMEERSINTKKREFIRRKINKLFEMLIIS